MRSLFVPTSTSLALFTTSRSPYLVLNPLFRRASHRLAPKFKQTFGCVRAGNARVLLNVLQPFTGTGTRKKTGRNVILYLPPGPLFASPDITASQSDRVPRSGQDDKLQTQFTAQHALAAASMSTVVTINYRLDRRTKEEGGDLSLKYPIPVHDTLAGFDWILERMKPSQLCVFGSYIGGSLAVMLALTESRSIRVVAALDPICDWVGLDDYCQIAPDADAAEDGEPSAGHHGEEADGVEAVQQPRKRGRRKKHAPPDLVPLLEARNRLFRKPAGYFDSFASPALFLRSSGKACPKAFPTYLSGPEYPVPILQRPVNLDEEDDEWFSDFLGTDSDIDFLPEAVEPASASASRKDVRRRKALIRWPPHGLDYGLDHYGSRSGEELPDQLVLPNVRIFVHSNLGNDDVTAPERIPENDDASEPEQAASIHEVGSDQSQTPTDGETTKPRQASRGPITDIRKSTTGETVLARQAAEMVSLMHHACFWGHPAGFGADRVKIVRVPSSKKPSPDETVATPAENQDSTDLGVENDVAKWFADILQAKKNEQGK